jgi:PspA-Associated protein
VIVRIATEGQYELQGGDEDRFRELDNEAVSACEVRDEQQFRTAFDRLLDFVRTHGQQVPEDRLEGSDVILPPPDISMHEAREEFTGEGLIPS